MKVDNAATSLSSSTAPGTPGAGFSIGALHGGTRPFTGEIDEVAVYGADITTSIAGHWAAGRRTDTATALTTRTSMDRLGRPTDSWDPKLMRTRAVYDRLGNQTQTIINYVNGTPSSGLGSDDLVSTFAYDILGELIGYCPAKQVQLTGCDPAAGGNAQAWHYGFDAMGRQTTTVPPVNTAVTALTTSETVYEDGGRIAKTCTYPAGQSCGTTNSRHVDFTYDDLGRILTQKTWDRGAGSDTLKFTKTLTWLKDGRPDTVAEGGTTLAYQYDTAARPTAFKNGSTTLTAWTYTNDAKNLLATRTDGTLGTTTFGYDWARRLTSVDPDDTYVAGVVNKTYRLDGLLATQAFPSSITETLSYDGARRPTGISLGSAGSLSQAYDRAGNVTSDGRSLTGISGDAGANTQSFNYDPLNRLTSSSLSAASRTYTYDLDGNRLSKAEGGTTTSYTYDRTDQLIKQTIGGVDKVTSFDRYGNLTQAADNANAYTSYAFDEANRLTTITPPTGSAATFTIDPLDRHATRTVGAAADTYGYVGPTETAFETSTTGVRSLLDLDGSRLAVKSGGTVRWVIFDLHGSVAALCPAGGTSLSDAYRYDGFGQTIDTSGSAANPWKYRGLLGIDPSSASDKLYDMVARDYAPATGTFTQLDSVQGQAVNPLSMNRYLYAQANPATLIDPDGHMTDATDGGACGAECRARQARLRWSMTVGVQKATAATQESHVFVIDPRIIEASEKAAELKAAGRSPWELSPIYQLREPVHAFLGGVGLVPIVGEPFDAVDGVMYGLEGDVVGAGLSLGAVVPGLGEVPGATKLARLGDDAASAAGDVAMVERVADDVPPIQYFPEDSGLIYRQGTPSPSNLRTRPGESSLSFRDSISNPYVPTEARGQDWRPVFRPGDQYFAVDTSLLRPGLVTFDNIPPGHVSVIPDPFLRQAVLPMTPWLRFPS